MSREFLTKRDLRKRVHKSSVLAPSKIHIAKEEENCLQIHFCDPYSVLAPSKIHIAEQEESRLQIHFCDTSSVSIGIQIHIAKEEENCLQIHQKFGAEGASG